MIFDCLDNLKRYKKFEKTCENSKNRIKKAESEAKECEEDKKSIEEEIRLQMQKRKKNNIVLLIYY